MYKIGDTIVSHFNTFNPSTGNVWDADFLPVCEVFEGSSETPKLSLIATKVPGLIGSYLVAIATVGNGFATGRSYSVTVSAVVMGVESRKTLASFILDSKRVGDLNADFGLINTQTDKIAGKMLFRLYLPATSYTTQVQLTTVAGNKALGSITIAGLPAGATVTQLFMHVKFASRTNSSAAINSVSGAQNIQANKDGGAYSTGIALRGGEFSTDPGSPGASDVMSGTTNLSGLAPANGSVIAFQWTSAVAAQDNLNFNDVQVILELWYSI